MQISKVTSFKESPFSTFQTSVPPQTPPGQEVKPQVPAPNIAQAQATTQAPQATVTQAQSAQVSAQPKKTDISKILSLGAIALSAGAIGVSIYKGKTEKAANITQDVKEAMDGLVPKLTEEIKEGLNAAIDTKVSQALADNASKTAEGLSTNTSKTILKILEGFGLALGGKEVADIIKGLPDKKDEDINPEALKKEIGTKAESTQKSNVANALQNEIKANKNLGLKVTTLSGEVSDKLKSEAMNRMHGDFKWNIETPKSWMVTAEVYQFYKEGGLAEVAGQLPEAFNEKYKGDKEAKMTVVAPLYTMSKSSDVTCKLEQNADGTYTYTGKEKSNGELNKIKLTKEADEYVKIYNSSKQCYSNEKFGVYKGTFNGVEFIFLQNDKYFSIDPQNENGKVSIYATNKDGIGETERFAMFSKAAVELMKGAKEGKVKNVEAPNVIIANDWHAFSMLPVMRYTIPAKASQDEIKKETEEYFESVPVIAVTHNAQMQGPTGNYGVADRIVKTLLEEYEPQINIAIEKSGAGRKYPMSTEYGNYNPFLAGANLADRLVAVSKNYAQELTSNEDMSGAAKDACLERKGHTLMGIVNGYDKSKAEPSENMINTINKTLKLKEGMQLKAYAGKEGEEAYQIKMEDKKVLSTILNDIAKSTTKNKDNKEMGDVAGMKNMTLYKPDQCKVPEGDDFVNTPVICDIGRMVEQKGFDYLAKAIENNAEYYGKKGIKPIFIVMGSGDEKYSKPLQQAKNKLLKTNPEIGERIFIFNGYNGDLRDAIYCGSDFTAIPSKWEPCGLTQMESMAKGTIPVVLAAGGLKDTVIPNKTGFVSNQFYGYSNNEIIYDNGKRIEGSIIQVDDNKDAFTVPLSDAIETFTSDREKIKELSINDMQQDFSWISSGSLDEHINVIKTGTLEG